MVRSKHRWCGTVKSHWKFWKYGVSASSLVLWLTCREQFRLRYVEAWRSRNVALPLIFGNVNHSVLEDMYRRKKPPGRKWIEAAIDEEFDDWKKGVGNPTQRQVEIQELACGLAMTVLPSYVKRWKGDWPGYEYPTPTSVASPVTWLSLEDRYTVNYEYDDGQVVPIIIVSDGVFRDKQEKVWVQDTKCLSRIDEENILATFDHDLQFMLYLWAYWKMNAECPRGLVMNIIRRPGQYRRKDERLRTYLDRIRADVANPKRWDHYFIRYEMELTGPSELAKWEETTLNPIMKEMRRWWEGTSAHYPNPTALVGKYGRCEMFDIITQNSYDNCYKQRSLPRG